MKIRKPIDQYLLELEVDNQKYVMAMIYQPYNLKITNYVDKINDWFILTYQQFIDFINQFNTNHSYMYARNDVNTYWDDVLVFYDDIFFVSENLALMIHKQSIFDAYINRVYKELTSEGVKIENSKTLQTIENLKKIKLV